MDGQLRHRLEIPVDSARSTATAQILSPGDDIEIFTANLNRDYLFKTQMFSSFGNRINQRKITPFALVLYPVLHPILHLGLQARPSSSSCCNSISRYDNIFWPCISAYYMLCNF